MRIILACDRSAGHIFPAKCLAISLRRNKVFFFAPSYYFRPLLEKEGYRVFGLPLRFRNIIIESFIRLWEGIYIIYRLRPRKVIGFGGRDTFFVVLWARLLFIDTVLYEPNMVMGKANKVLYPLVKKVYRGFYIPRITKKGVWVGIPVRDELKKQDKKEAREKLGLETSSAVILCFGGSQGSEFINNKFGEFAKASKEPFQIIHITGLKQKRYFLEFYDKISRKAVVYDFFKAIDLLYSAADIVISRSGALTVAEVSYYRLPAVFVPYPGAGNHQYANADYLEKRKACFIVPQSDFSSRDFSMYIEILLKDNVVRRNMADNLGRLKVAVKCGEFYRNFDDTKGFIRK